MGKTRDLFKKMRDTKGTFHAKMGSIKDRNGMDLTEAEDIKKRWQEYTEELYKRDLHNPDNHDGVITHLEPGTRGCEKKKKSVRAITPAAKAVCVPAHLVPSGSLKAKQLCHLHTQLSLGQSCHRQEKLASMPAGLLR